MEDPGGNLPVGRTWGQNTRARAAVAWQAVFPHSHGNRSDSLWLGCFLSLFLNAAPVCSGEHFSSPYGGLPLAGPWGDPLETPQSPGGRAVPAPGQLYLTGVMLEPHKCQRQPSVLRGS